MRTLLEQMYVSIRVLQRNRTRKGVCGKERFILRNWLVIVEAGKSKIYRAGQQVRDPRKR